MSTVIFDLDGTLVDSADVLCGGGNTVLAERGLTLMETDEARSYIGNGARAFVTKMLTARDAVDPETFEAIFERYSALYAAAPGAANIPFPHVDETLRQLVSLGHRLALCTNKPTAPTDALLAAHAWTDLFGAVVCGDTLAERKPHPEPLRAAARQLGSPPVVYVGDSEVDAAAADAAGFPFFLYTEGFRLVPTDTLVFAEAFDDFRALPQKIAAFNGLL
ncbi:MAG: phosphoglycolate phosphatase [Pseudomonadota bacterium]|nr:phosphoglycolate phosphatase [Pseudomonadota bacterium]